MFVSRGLAVHKHMHFSIVSNILLILFPSMSFIMYKHQHLKEISVYNMQYNYRCLPTNLSQLHIFRPRPLILIHRQTLHTSCDYRRAQNLNPQPEQLHVSNELFHQAAHFYIYFFVRAVRQFHGPRVRIPAGSTCDDFLEVFVVKNLLMSRLHCVSGL